MERNHFSRRAESGSVLIPSVISAKEIVNQPSFKHALLLSKAKYTSKDHCVFVSCWAFLRRYESRFLAGPTISRMGNRPAFLSPDAARARHQGKDRFDGRTEEQTYGNSRARSGW